MPRVLRIINRFNLGGISYNVSYLSRFMSPQFETMLIGGPEEAGEESSLFIPHSMGLEPTLIMELRRSINPFSDFFAYRKIKKIIRQYKPDIVHTHASKAGAIGRLAAIHCKVPVIVHTFHGHVFEGYFGKLRTTIFINIERYFSRRSSAIVAISNIQKKELTERFKVCKADQTVVIPLGFDLRRFAENLEEKRKAFRSKFALKDNELAIGIIGRLAPIKNHYLFIDAIGHLLSRTHKTVKAFVIGDGETRKDLEDYVKAKNISVITFAGWMKEVDLALAGLDIVCLTSKNEGTPVSLIEAQAAGRFVVSTDVGGIRDILYPGCGLLSDWRDAEAFYSNLVDAVTNFDRYNKGAGAAREEVLKKFSYTRLCRDMEDLYNSLLEKSGS